MIRRGFLKQTAVVIFTLLPWPCVSQDRANIKGSAAGRVTVRFPGLHGYIAYGCEQPPPTRGKLVSLDPSLLVKPPPGLEVGYVPIVASQSMP